MVTVIGVIEKGKFDKSNYNPVIQDSFIEFMHRNQPHMKVFTFEKYTIDVPIDNVFYSDDEFNDWFLFVPPFISKLQAVSHLLEIGRYNDLMAVLDSDPTGEKRILFGAAHQLDRDSTMVNQLGSALGYDSEGLDNLFTEASKILV
jgi:hypothetical protein